VCELTRSSNVNT